MNSTYIIAEAGVNHNGSLDIAKKLVEAAATAGADAVKFQTFSAKRLATNSAKMAEYQIKNTGVLEPQIDMLERLELPENNFSILQKYCIDLDIDFLSSPFDIESAQFLISELGLECIKIPSGEITNGPFLLAIGQSNKSVILSTGMSTLEEIEQALDVLSYGYLNKPYPKSIEEITGCASSSSGSSILKEKVQLLHCTTEYPAPVESINLRAMDTIKYTFELPVGYSDHSEGIVVSIAAVAMGAIIIEKHLTLDRSMPGPDHRASIEPALFSEMVRSIRVIEGALGTDKKQPHEVELKNIRIARKKIVASQSIKKGGLFSTENLVTMRPGDGQSPMGFWDLLDQPSKQSYLLGDPIQE
jgi:N-acetylneuraminate synthase